MEEEALYDNVVTSLVKWIQDFRKEVAPDAQYVDWDAHAQISELPLADVIGPAGCGLSENSPGDTDVVFSFGVGTYGDRNLIRLRKISSQLYGRLKVGLRIPVLDSETGAELAWMVVKAPRALTPVTKAETRSLQFVELTAKLDPGATSSLR